MNQLSEEQKPKWDKSGLKEACQRGLAIGRTHQEFDLQLLLDMLLEIERLESSLLDSDSQAVAPDAKEIVDQFEALRTSSSLIDVEVSYGYLTQAISTLQKRAATAMRDKCVEKVKTARAEIVSCRPGSMLGHLVDELLAELSSLTLDQVKPGEM